MSGINGGKLFTGKATITFAGGLIAYADNCEIVLNPTVLIKGDVLGSSGALDAMCPVKGVAINVQDSDMSLDSFSAASGFNGNVTTNPTNGARALLLDTSVVTLPEGPCALAFTRPGSGSTGPTQMRLYLKRAKKLPQSQSVKLSNQSFSEFTYQLLMVDPADGGSVAGQFDEGYAG